METMLARRSIIAALVSGYFLQKDPWQPLGTPRATSSSTVEPVTLENGATLIDYRAFGDSRFVGEVLNPSDAPLDTPVVGLTVYDADGNIISTGEATPEIPVMLPGESSVVTGRLDPEVPDLAAAVLEVSGCFEGGSSVYTDRQMAMDVSLEQVEEDRQSSSYLANGVVRNNGTVEVEGVAVYGLFRDADGRVVGAASSALSRAIPPGKTMVFELDVGVNTFLSNDPFDLITGDYSVELRTGTQGGVYVYSCG